MVHNIQPGIFEEVTPVTIPKVSRSLWILDPDEKLQQEQKLKKEVKDQLNMTLSLGNRPCNLVKSPCSGRKHCSKWVGRNPTGANFKGDEHTCSMGPGALCLQLYDAHIFPLEMWTLLFSYRDLYVFRKPNPCYPPLSLPRSLQKKTCFYFTVHLLLKFFSLRVGDGSERPGQVQELAFLSSKEQFLAPV